MTKPLERKGYVTGTFVACQSKIVFLTGKDEVTIARMKRPGSAEKLAADLNHRLSNIKL
ncbi:MAG: hypothetical protein WBA93_06990 [Microcoleaceae cyanobacterium]